MSAEDFARMKRVSEPPPPVRLDSGPCTHPLATMQYSSSLQTEQVTKGDIPSDDSRPTANVHEDTALYEHLSGPSALPKAPAIDAATEPTSCLLGDDIPISSTHSQITKESPNYMILAASGSPSAVVSIGREPRISDDELVDFSAIPLAPLTIPDDPPLCTPEAAVFPRDAAFPASPSLEPELETIPEAQVLRCQQTPEPTLPVLEENEAGEVMEADSHIPFVEIFEPDFSAPEKTPLAPHDAIIMRAPPPIIVDLASDREDFSGSEKSYEARRPSITAMAAPHASESFQTSTTSAVTISSVVATTVYERSDSGSALIAMSKKSGALDEPSWWSPPLPSTLPPESLEDELRLLSDEQDDLKWIDSDSVQSLAFGGTIQPPLSVVTAAPLPPRRARFPSGNVLLSTAAAPVSPSKSRFRVPNIFASLRSPKKKEEVEPNHLKHLAMELGRRSQTMPAAPIVSPKSPKSILRRRQASGAKQHPLPDLRKSEPVAIFHAEFTASEVKPEADAAQFSSARTPTWIKEGMNFSPISSPGQLWRQADEECVDEEDTYSKALASQSPLPSPPMGSEDSNTSTIEPNERAPDPPIHTIRYARPIDAIHDSPKDADVDNNILEEQYEEVLNLRYASVDRVNVGGDLVNSKATSASSVEAASWPRRRVAVRSELPNREASDSANNATLNGASDNESRLYSSLQRPERRLAIRSELPSGTASTDCVEGESRKEEDVRRRRVPRSRLASAGSGDGELGRLASSMYGSTTSSLYARLSPGPQRRSRHIRVQLRGDGRAHSASALRSDIRLT